MLDNTITLAVDEDHDGGSTTVNVDHVYNRFDQYQNRTVYTSEAHTLSIPDTLTFYRTFPKTSGNYPGQAKVAAKFSTQQTIPGVNGENVTGPFLVEMSFSMPVGTSSATMLLMRQRASALLNRDDIMDALMESLVI